MRTKAEGNNKRRKRKHKCYALHHDLAMTTIMSLLDDGYAVDKELMDCIDSFFPINTEEGEVEDGR